MLLIPALTAPVTGQHERRLVEHVGHGPDVASHMSDSPDGLRLAGGVTGIIDPHGLDPSDPYARAAETFPRLTDEQVNRVAAFGTVQALPKGTVLFERDDRGVDFFLVLAGFIEI